MYLTTFGTLRTTTSSKCTISNEYLLREGDADVRAMVGRKIINCERYLYPALHRNCFYSERGKRGPFPDKVLTR